MKLLTVTCDRDKSQMILQAESLDRYVDKSCEHFVIVNEDNPNLVDWYRDLSSFYKKKHRLILLNRIHADCTKIEKYLTEGSRDFHGWQLQQIQKLLFAYYIEDDYILLDSKNFFINPTDIEQWESDEYVANKLRLVHEMDLEWIRTAKSYATFFNKPLFFRYPIITTPYKINYKFIVNSKLFTKETLIDSLFFPRTIDAGNISEFLFYSYLIPEDHVFWKNVNKEYYNEISLVSRPELTDNINTVLKDLGKIFCFNKDKSVATIHKSIFANHESMKNIDFYDVINFFLEERGFVSKLYPTKQKELNEIGDSNMQ